MKLELTFFRAAMSNLYFYHGKADVFDCDWRISFLCATKYAQKGITSDIIAVINFLPHPEVDLPPDDFLAKRIGS